MLTFKLHNEYQNASKGVFDIEKFSKEQGFSEWDLEVFITQLQLSYPLQRYNNIKGFKVLSGIEQMTYGQFMNFEHYLNNFVDNVYELVSLIIRPEDEEGYHTENHDKHMAAVIELPCNEVETVLNDFLEDRTHVLYTKYKNVIYKEPKENTDSAETDTTEDGIESAEQQFSKNFFFYEIARALVKEDITKIQDAYQAPMEDVFIELAFTAARSRIEEAKNKIEEHKSRMKNIKR